MSDIQASGVILGVAGSAIVMLLGVVGRFVWQKFARIDQVAEEQEEMKYNYMTRFDEVKSLISSENTSTRKAIADLHLDLARNYVRKDECAHCLTSGRTGADPHE